MQEIYPLKLSLQNILTNYRDFVVIRFAIQQAF